MSSGDKIKGFIQDSWSVSWPMTLILFFQFLMGLTDVFVAGRVGKEVQAAYGFVFQFYFIFTVIAVSINVGAVAVISRMFSSGDRSEFQSTVFTSIATSLGAGALLGVAAMLFSPLIIKSLYLPAPIKEYGLPLMRIYAAGVVFHYLLVNTNGILRASGAIRKSLISMAVATAVNIPLNFFFVFHTKIGFPGIALSTVISLAAGVACNAPHVLKMIDGGLRFSLEQAKKIINIGWPIGLLQVAWQLGTAVMFFIVGFLPARQVETIAAMTNGLRLESAIFLPAFAFNMANAVVVGNTLGRGREARDEAQHRGVVTAVIGVVIVIVLTAIVLLNARRALTFLSDSPVVVEEGVRYLYITLISEPFMAWGVILGGGLNGAGDTRSVMKIVTLSFWIIRIPLSYIFGIVLGLGAPAVWWAMNISIFAQCALISRRYFGKGWLANA